MSASGRKRPQVVGCDFAPKRSSTLGTGAIALCTEAWVGILLWQDSC